MKSNMLLIVVLLPLAVGVLALLIPKAVKWVREILAVLTTAAVFAGSLWVFFRGAPDISIALLQIGQFSLSFDLVLTRLASFILLFVAGFSFLVSFYSLSHMSKSPGAKPFHAFLLIALSGSAGVVLAGHFILLLIFWEIVTAALYFLINSGGPGARAGATKTFAMLGGVDGCLLLGIGLLWFITKTPVIGAMVVPVTGWAATLAFILMMVAAITKAGSLPFASWLPAASKESPAPVMALLPASIDKLLGIYLLVKITTSVFTIGNGMGLMLMIIGGVTIIAAVLVAVVQHDLKQLLSYHAISQVGYMILGIGTLTPIGLVGGLFHMVNNSLYKGLLFLCGGAVEKKTGTTDLGELGGLARAMPITFISCLIGALAISGVPPLNGFVSKWMVYQGVLDTGTSYSFVFLIIAMFGSALTLASFVKVIYSMFLGTKTPRTVEVKRDASVVVTIPLIVLAATCVVFGVYYKLPLTKLIFPAIGMEPVVTGIWNSTLATGLLLIGMVLGFVLFFLGRYRKSVRVVGAFTGGEALDEKTGRVSATHFYDTVRTMPGLRWAYRLQENGKLDPHNWIGGLGLRFTGVLKRVHSGVLPWYLSWILVGTVALMLLLWLLL